MSGNALLRYGLASLIILPVGLLLLYPQLIRCLWVDQSSDYQLLAPASHVYVNKQTTTQQQQQLYQHIRAAQTRISQFWGSRRGKAVLIYCPNQTDYEQFCAGGEGAGCSLGFPWGASYLVLGPDGNDTDVIAHELCHDELFSRLGWWRVKRQIPQWFNEGLALMVDYRFSQPNVWEQADSTTTLDNAWTETGPLSVSGHPMLKLSDLETTRDFFGGSYNHTMLAYQTAAEELVRWLSIVGRVGVSSLTDAIANGTDFHEAYRALERRKRQKGVKNP